jgi:hypothetical protein
MKNRLRKPAAIEGYGPPGLLDRARSLGYESRGGGASEFNGLELFKAKVWWAYDDRRKKCVPVSVSIEEQGHSPFLVEQWGMLNAGALAACFCRGGGRMVPRRIRLGGQTLSAVKKEGYVRYRILIAKRERRP